MKAITGSQVVWLTVIRVFTGVFWLVHAWLKIANPAFGSPQGNVGVLVANATSTSSGAFRDFLVGVIQPHLVLFATITTYAEVLIGLLLVLGIVTRAAAFAAFIFATLYWLMGASYGSIEGYANANATAIVLSLTNVFLPTRAVSFDSLNARRREARKIAHRTAADVQSSNQVIAEGVDSRNP